MYGGRVITSWTFDVDYVTLNICRKRAECHDQLDVITNSYCSELSNLCQATVVHDFGGMTLTLPLAMPYQNMNNITV